MSAENPGARLARWREANWPPTALRQYGQLPIYLGDHDTVAVFTETLAEAMMVAADHIYDACRGQIPRWMHVPKVYFGVERLNVAQSVAKASKRFSTVSALNAKCGAFPKADMAGIAAWLDSREDAEVVAHKQFVDMRAYVFVKDKPEPQRVRFYESGLLLAVSDGFVAQDHRNTVRRVRRDVLQGVLGSNEKGWTVFGV